MPVPLPALRPRTHGGDQSDDSMVKVSGMSVKTTSTLFGERKSGQVPLSPHKTMLFTHPFNTRRWAGRLHGEEETDVFILPASPWSSAHTGT